MSRFKAEVTANLLLSLPLAGAQLAQAATGFIDTIMMGMLGSQFLAAGGLGTATFSALLIISTGIVSAISPLVAEAKGAGRLERVGQVTTQGLWLAVAMGIPTALLIWHMGSILRLVGQEEANVVLAETFLQAIAWGFVPALAFAVLKNVVAALAQPRPVLLIMLCGTLCNGLGNYILMFGKLGLPALGLAGIGWSSAISLWLMLVALVLYILRHPAFIPCRLLRHLHQVDRLIFLELLHIGLPIGILFAVEAGLFTVTTLLMGHLGTTTLAAHQIAIQTASITYMVPLGISVATTIRVGQLSGQGDHQSARQAGYVGIGLGGLFMTGMAALFWLAPQEIVSLYLDVHQPANQAVVHMAIALLGVATLFQIADGIQIIAAGALRGLKDTRIPMLIGIIAYWGIGLTTGYLFGFQLKWGGVGLWLGLAMGLVCAAIVLTWRFHDLISNSPGAKSIYRN